MTDWVTVAVAVAAGTGSALLALALMRVWPAPGVGRRRPAAQGPVEPLAFLFCNRRLVDATGAGRSLLSALPGEDDWGRLGTWLAQRFDPLGDILAQAEAEGVATATGAAQRGSATLRLRVEHLGGGLVRIEVVDPDLEHAGITINAHSLAAMEDELAVLRESVDHAPVLIWREDGTGQVTWANAAYLQEAESQAPDEVRWPLPRLIALPADAEGTRRAQIELDDQIRWFDCHLQQADGHRTVFAVPADAAVRAERSLREFVQTLTKTFADLPTGLAIFDRERRLQLFNPALIDLTGLPVGFLTARPTLYALLDGLRERRMVPEPRDYASWRNAIATLESEAASGHHVETWSLPGGQTYRVTGRPHPDGAIAFLFEDITTSIAMTRRFKAELSLGAEILDGLEASVAIFDADGRLLNTNRNFDATWGEEGSQTLRGWLDAWRRIAADSPGYQALRRAIAGDRDDAALTGAIAGPDRAILSWRVQPLSGGRRMVIFHPSVVLGLTRTATAADSRATDPSAPLTRGDVRAEEAAGAA